MKKTQMREFARHVTEIIRRIERSGEPVVVLRHHNPIAFVIAVDSVVGQDLTLALAPETTEILSAAERERIDGRAPAWERA